LNFAADRPDKAEQLSAECRDYFLLGFAASHQRSVALVQPVLCAPSDEFERLALPVLPRPQSAAQRRMVAVIPRRLGHDAAQMRISSLADRAAVDSRSARVLARAHSGI